MFQEFKINNKQAKLQLTYKLLHDLLFILLLFLAATLLAEGLLPGIVSSHVGISKLIIPIAGIIFLISLISPAIKSGIRDKKKPSGKKMIFFLSLFGIILVLNSLLKAGILLNLTITILVTITTYVVYVIMIKEEA
ncbi:MAG: hypothetical protein WC238_02520 [Parcubacteria group bacterium]|jgi:hypothetical protein